MTIISTRLYEAAKPFRDPHSSSNDPTGPYSRGNQTHDQVAELINAWNAAGNPTRGEGDEGYILTQLWGPNGPLPPNQFKAKTLGVSLAAIGLGGLLFGPWGAVAGFLLPLPFGPSLFPDTE